MAIEPRAKPEGWTDEDWAEFLEWEASLPLWDEGPDVKHASIGGGAPAEIEQPPQL